MEAERELERIIGRMQRIQRDIARSGHPAFVTQIEELKELGREYARVIERFRQQEEES